MSNCRPVADDPDLLGRVELHEVVLPEGHELGEHRVVVHAAEALVLVGEVLPDGSSLHGLLEGRRHGQGVRAGGGRGGSTPAVPLGTEARLQRGGWRPARCAITQAGGRPARLTAPV
jgi:hypothetical protein